LPKKQQTKQKNYKKRLTSMHRRYKTYLHMHSIKSHHNKVVGS